MKARADPKITTKYSPREPPMGRGTAAFVTAWIEPIDPAATTDSVENSSSAVAPDQVPVIEDTRPD